MENGGGKRLTISAAAIVVLGAVAQGYISSSTEYASKATGADALPYRVFVAAMNKMAAITSSGPFIAIAMLLLGAAIYSWGDFLARKWSEWRASHATFDRRLTAMTLIYIFSVGLILSAAWLLYERHYEQPKQRTDTPKTETTTSINLRFGIGSATPVATQTSNIWRWYALNTAIRTPDGSTQSMVWSIFLTLDKPTNVNQVVLTSSGALPPYEVKDRDQRSIVIVINGPVENVDLKVTVLTDLKPRQLTPDQLKKIETYLLPRDHQKITIVQTTTDQEANEFGAQFLNLFIESGWEAERRNYLDETLPKRFADYKDRTGMFLVTFHGPEFKGGTPKNAGLVDRAFHAAGVPLSSELGEANSPSAKGAETLIFLVIGKRPTVTE